jgi:hypothetical protein
VARHPRGLGSAGTCRVARSDEWIHGNFNLCMPIGLFSHGNTPDKNLMIRFPLPYRVGEEFRHGNVDEKLRCEARMYAWLQENCPAVPIPRLYGFGFSTGERFTVLESFSFPVRIFNTLCRQLFARLGYQPLPSTFLIKKDVRQLKG